MGNLMFVKFLKAQYHMIEEVAGNVLRDVGGPSVLCQGSAATQRDRGDVPQVVVVVLVDKVVIKFDDIFVFYSF